MKLINIVNVGIFFYNLIKVRKFTFGQNLNDL